METLPDDIQNIIYKYKHQLEFKYVLDELNKIVDFWCIDQLTFRYCKCRHQSMYIDCCNLFHCLNDYENHLLVDLLSADILCIINDN